jgi:hypothetical protein
VALELIHVVPTAGDLPARVEEFARTADARIDEFLARRVKRPLHAFVPSDLAASWRVLDAIVRGRFARGRAFCEWGCGFAAVAGIAALVGFDACGIEFEGDLVDEARRLAADFGLPILIARGTFVPPDAGELDGCNDELTWIAEGGPDGHALLRRDPDDFDVVFAYPWPGEEEVIFRLFDQFAAVGALLLTGHGEAGFLLHRKVE